MAGAEHGEEERPDHGSGGLHRVTMAAGEEGRTCDGGGQGASAATGDDLHGRAGGGGGRGHCQSGARRQGRCGASGRSGGGA